MLNTPLSAALGQDGDRSHRPES